MTTLALWKIEPSHVDLLIPLSLQPQPDTLDAASKRIPGGAYTTFRTFSGNRVLHLSDHFRRLEETARLAGHPIQLDWEPVRRALRLAVERFAAPESRLRLTLDLEQRPGDLYLALEPLHMPSPAQYHDGVDVVTRELKRINPKAKLTNFIGIASEIRQEIPPDVNEALMVDENGIVLEGLSSNFFGVRGGQIWTAEEGVLSGITRSIVLEEIEREGIPLHRLPVAKAELAALDEAFITSASRAVLPVTRIDGLPVADGRPGEITRRLLERYNRRIAAETEPL